MKVRTIKELERLCKDHYRDADGYWYILNNNWIAKGYYSEKTIHEDTKRDVLDALRGINFWFTLNG